MNQWPDEDKVPIEGASVLELGALHVPVPMLSDKRGQGAVLGFYGCFITSHD